MMMKEEDGGMQAGQTQSNPVKPQRSFSLAAVGMRRQSVPHED